MTNLMPDGSNPSAQQDKASTRRRRGEAAQSAHRSRSTKSARLPVFGAVDLGTNNCRLLIAKPNGTSFRVIGSFSRIVRLGEGLHATGTLAPAAMTRTIDALKICAQIMRRHGVSRVRCIATEACRRAKNGAEFLDRIALETGLMFEAVTSDEEAHLTLSGCAELLDRSLPRAVVFDIGGGSTEVMWLSLEEDKPKPVGILSIPLGVVTLSERYQLNAKDETRELSGNAIASDAYQNLVQEIDSHLTPFDVAYGISDGVQRGNASLLGTSGTITTLGGLYLDLPKYDRNKVDGLVMKTDDLLSINQHLVDISAQERAQIGCIGQERADLMVMGCAILEAICRRWPVPFIRAADRGIREGLLCAMLSDHLDTVQETHTSP